MCPYFVFWSGICIIPLKREEKQRRSLDQSIAKLEGELNVIFHNEKIDCLEIEMGMLVRRKTEKGTEWVIEI